MTILEKKITIYSEYLILVFAWQKDMISFKTICV